MIYQSTIDMLDIDDMMLLRAGRDFDEGHCFSLFVVM